MTEVVDYSTLDAAKQVFVDACSKTTSFASQFGNLSGNLGNSANIFELDISPFIQAGQNKIYTSMLPEGLGTADDARPEDLSPAELNRFWRNIAGKTLSCLTNDAASSGIQTLLIGLYLPSSTPETVFGPDFLKGFFDGFIKGCKSVGCVYFCGETPQLKNKIIPNKLDIAGSLFGIVPAGLSPITGTELDAGNHIVFVESSGPHENGFTTLRKMASELKDGYRTALPSGMEYWEAINQPGLLYTPLIQKLMQNGVKLTNVEPITGHGWQKLMRQKKALRYRIQNILPPTEVFRFIQNQFGLSTKKMLEIFNYGTGLALFTKSKSDAERSVSMACELGLKACVAGIVEPSAARQVAIEPWDVVLGGEAFTL